MTVIPSSFMADCGRNAMANQDNFANTHLSGEKMYISYYQWVPITIAMSAVLFYLPHVLWCSLTQNSGFYFKHILYGRCAPLAHGPLLHISAKEGKDHNLLLVNLIDPQQLK